MEDDSKYEVLSITWCDDANDDDDDSAGAGFKAAAWFDGW
jgi:hypothetical protein